MGNWTLRAVIGGSCVLLAAAAQACGSSDSTPAPTTPAADGGAASVSTPTQAAATVGATGGTVTTTGGDGVEIPAGALGNNVQVSVTESPNAAPPPAATQLGTPAVFGPSGLQFQQPVTVVLTFDPTKLPAGKTVADIVVYTAPEGTTNFTPLPTEMRDATHVAAQTTHFSVMVPTVPDAVDAGPSSGTPDAGCTARLCGFYGPGTCGGQQDGCGGMLDCGPCLTSGADAGVTNTDSGVSEDDDSGVASADSGVASADSGVTGADAGVTDDDSGVSGADAGVADTDSGVSGDDDGGTTFDDAGSGESDASVGSNDAGASCQNPLTCANYEAAAGVPLCGSYADGCGNSLSCTDGCDAGSGASDASALMCGDGIVEGGESCDDGNTQPGDGCSATCQIEAGWSCPTPDQACTKD